VDIVFPSAKVAVDVRGCFWHGCPKHGTAPKANTQWWAAKLEQNRLRDADTAKRLRQAGWKLVVVWSHEEPSTAAKKIGRLVDSRTNS
jgi:DNA mismatch endonuclease (patch repair protein)